MFGAVLFYTTPCLTKGTRRSPAPFLDLRTGDFVYPFTNPIGQVPATRSGLHYISLGRDWMG